MSFCFIIDFIDRIVENKTIKILSLGIIIILLVKPSYDKTKNMLDREISGTHEMSSYIQSSIEKNDKMIVYTYAPDFIIHNKVKTVYYNINGNGRGRVVEEIQENGFTKTMQNHNIKYYMTANTRDFKDILPWFDKEAVYKCDTPMQGKIDQRKCIFEQEKMYKIYKPYQYFNLEKKFGNFLLFRIKEYKSI